MITNYNELLEYLTIALDNEYTDNDIDVLAKQENIEVEYDY